MPAEPSARPRLTVVRVVSLLVALWFGASLLAGEVVSGRVFAYMVIIAGLGLAIYISIAKPR